MACEQLIKNWTGQQIVSRKESFAGPGNANKHIAIIYFVCQYSAYADAL